MMRNMGMMAGLLVLAACGEKGGVDAGKPAAGDVDAVVTPAEPFVAGATEVIPTTKCPDSRIGDPLIMLISNQMLKQLGGNDQQIERNITQSGKGSMPPTLDDKKFYPTNLDLAANGDLSRGGYVEIHIMLQPAKPDKRDLTFIRMDASAVPPNDKDSAGAVTVRLGDGVKFCGRMPVEKDSVSGMETVKFGSLLVAGEESSINIGVLVANKKDRTKWTPIYIDPNMKNEG
ncbi:hypothetical protein [Sandarakinorhabdus sp.]|uniref:hypothetical protein n=1 Tax=Sandarakinorhabdus sp. TaxID=1916663 RepID=UPI00286DD623|nr:hypothetical protein [Sandarakinorhabdus sp.]